MSTPAAARLPRSWTKTARSGVLHAVSLAFTAVTSAWGVGAASKRGVTCLKAELDRAQTEIALLREELAIKDARWRRVSPRRRPHYGPVERMRILKLKAARSWSAVQTSERFFVTMVTIATWLERVDEVGERALVQLKEPVNRFPDHVRDLVRWLKSVCPTLGKVRIAQALARAGLSLGATTVGRMLADAGPIREPDDEALEVWEEVDAPARIVTAKCPDHVWHVDMTLVPTGSGFWVPWAPFTLPQSWPFAWWLAVAVDHFSRRLHGFALFVKQPSAEEVCAFLDRTIERCGARPKHVITDQAASSSATSSKRGGKREAYGIDWARSASRGASRSWSA